MSMATVRFLSAIIGQLIGRHEMGLRLILGNKNYSSWSMRAWLLLRFVDTPFDEITISLYVPGSRAKVIELGGQTGLVPVLEADGYPIWDTLAITEYLFEQHRTIWPVERFARARARSYAGEVHSSLNALRNAMPVNTRGRQRLAVRTECVEQEIARVVEIWTTSGAYRDGPWLFGPFCAVDIMFAPMASRFLTYGVSVTGQAAQYMNQLLSHPLVTEWFELGRREPTVIDQFELPKRG
jgi:glutathione S-transferase